MRVYDVPVPGWEPARLQVEDRGVLSGASLRLDGEGPDMMWRTVNVGRDGVEVPLRFNAFDVWARRPSVRLGKGRIPFMDAVPWPSYIVALLPLILLAGGGLAGGVAGFLALG